MHRKILTPFITLLALLANPLLTHGAALTGEDIIKKSQNVYGGDDSVAHIAYKTELADGTIDRLELTRVWKLYKKDGIHSKVMSFNSYPPASVGVGTLVIAYEFSQNKQPDTWVYIPVLRKVKYLPPLKDKSQNRGEDDPFFASSQMKTRELTPRDPSLDTHKLLGQKTLNGIPHYVVESTPKDKQFEKYSKTRNWIRKDNFLTTRVDFYKGDKKALIQRIQWKKIGDAWTWEKVVGKNRNGSKTTITITDAKINTGLKDSVFDQRTLKRGWR